MTQSTDNDAAAVQGTVDFTVRHDGAEEVHQTWYRVVGDWPPAPGAPAPLVTLHGGPGATHDYLLTMADLAGDGRAVVFYDQIGNGRSTHLPDRGADFWTVDLFVRELHNLVDSLGLRGGHSVLGQSWGGFLAQEYALTAPTGLRSLVLADTAASFPESSPRRTGCAPTCRPRSRRRCAATKPPAPPTTRSTPTRARCSTPGMCAGSTPGPPS